MAEVKNPHERKNKQRIHDHIRHHGNNANADRRFHVLASVITRGQYFNEHESR